MDCKLQYLGEGRNRTAYKIVVGGKPTGLVVKICKKTPTESLRESEAIEYWKGDPVVEPHLPTIFAHDKVTGTVVMPEYGKAERRMVRELETYLCEKLDKPSIKLEAKQIGTDANGTVVMLDMAEMLPRRKPRRICIS